MELVIACDGGCLHRDGRPLLATYAFVAYEGSYVIYQSSGVVCRGRWANSMVAEYGAIVAALAWATRRTLPIPNRVRVLCDSSSLIERLLGQCTIQSWRGYRLLHRAALKGASCLRRQGCQVVLEHVHRGRVAAAHDLATLAYRHELRLPWHSSSGSDSISAFLRTTRAQSL